MIDYINRPKSGFSFFLNQFILLFSVLFFGSSCFESTIKDKGKKPYEYKESITSQRLNKRLNKNHNHFMDHLDEASTKIKENCFQDHTQNQKEDRKASIRTGCQENRRRESNEHTLSEEEDDDEGLQNAIEASIRTASQEDGRRQNNVEGFTRTAPQGTRRRENNEHTLSEEEDDDEGLQNAIEASIRTAPQEDRRRQNNVEGFTRTAYQETRRTQSFMREALTIPLERCEWKHYCYLELLAKRKEASNDPTEIEEAKKIRERLAKIYDKLLDKAEEKQRDKHALPISKDEAINKLKKILNPVQLDELRGSKKDCQCKECPTCKEECIICAGELGPDGCYATTCCKQMPLHIDCIADSAIASYNSMAGKDPNPQYKCPFCSRSLF